MQLKKSTRAALCLQCGKCSTMCPLALFSEFSAARMMSIQDPEAEIRGHALAAQRCLTCASCEFRCPQGVRYTEFVRGLRYEIPESDRMPCPHGELLQAAARLAGELPRHGQRPSWLDEDLAVADEGEVALFVGCLPQFDVLFGQDLDVEMVEIARAAVRLLNHLGIEPVIVSQELCCGHDLLWGGDAEAFEKRAAANVATLQERGVRRVLTTCAECCRTWRLDYPTAVPEFNLQVEHISEVLEAALDAEQIGFEPKDGGRVTYQDPCRLGRQLGVYEAPRRLLDAVPDSERVEMDRARADAQCCGTPGFIYCDAVSRRLQEKRLHSASATGAETLVTACPKCLLHFRCAQSEDRRTGRPAAAIRVQDLTVFVADRLKSSAGSQDGAGLETQQTGEAL
jgi:Fe-S oxidoreductase